MLAAAIVGLGAAQQEAQDMLRTPLDVAWVGPKAGRDGVSGSALGRVTAVIQFDDILVIVALVSPCWE